MATTSSKKFGAWLTEQRQKLLGFIRKRVPAEEDAEDLVQDVMIQFLQAMDLQERIEQVSGWMYKVARNKIINWYRKKRPENFSNHFIVEELEDGPLYLEELLQDTNALPDEIYSQSLIWPALEAALEELPPEQRQVFLLHEIEGMSFTEIADLTGVGVNTLLSRKRYAILHLRDRLEILYNELINE